MWFGQSTIKIMQKITYLVNWGRNKETAWSGTNYSLYKALKSKYDIKDINLSCNRWVLASLRRILRISPSKLNKWDRFRLRKTNGKVFQFAEVLFDTPDRTTYMYVDETIGHVNYLKNNQPSVYEISGYQYTAQHIWEKRQLEQDEYIHSCSGLFTMGHWLREWLIDQGFDAGNIHAVGGGVNVDASLIAPQQKSHNKILFIGKDFRRKGGFITYEAFKLLREQDEQVELYVIGPKENPIANPVDGYHFVGQIPFNEEAKYYNMCDVFCMPSYFEAYGLVFIEALTFGLPCIGRNCYEMPYFIQDGETGLLLKHDDPHELASLMLQVLRDDKYAKNVAAHHDQYLHDYSWDAVAERMAKVIR